MASRVPFSYLRQSRTLKRSCEEIFTHFAWQIDFYVTNLWQGNCFISNIAKSSHGIRLYWAWSDGSLVGCKPSAPDYSEFYLWASSRLHHLCCGYYVWCENPVRSWRIRSVQTMHAGSAHTANSHLVDCTDAATAGFQISDFFCVAYVCIARRSYIWPEDAFFWEKRYVIAWSVLLQILKWEPGIFYTTVE